MRKLVIPVALALGYTAGNAIADEPNWTSASQGNLPNDAVVGGHEVDGSSLFICRTDNGTGLTPGKIRPGFGGCSIAFGGAEVFLPRYDVLTPAWQNASGGSVPSNATYEGADEAPPPGSLFGPLLYFCRAPFAGGIHPGKVRNGFGGCLIPWGGKEISVPNYEVLVNLNPKLPVTTIPATAVSIPTDALVGGRELTGDKLFICQAFFNGGLHPGKTRAGLGGCNISWGGNEITIPNFSVLVPNWITNSPYSFNVGMEAGQNFFACRASYNQGVHPGKLRTDFQQCHIGWGGKEVLVPNFQVLSDNPPPR